MKSSHLHGQKQDMQNTCRDIEAFTACKSNSPSVTACRSCTQGQDGSTRTDNDRQRGQWHMCQLWSEYVALLVFTFLCTFWGRLCSWLWHVDALIRGSSVSTRLNEPPAPWLESMPWLLLPFALLRVRMEVQSRVLCWHHTRYLIIISQTITGLIVNGEIGERREQKCQVYWEEASSFSEFSFFPFILEHRSHPSPLLIPVASQNNTDTKSALRCLPERQPQTDVCIPSPRTFLVTVLWKEEEKEWKAS